MDRVISSYLPTLRALAFAQARQPKKYLNHKRDASLLVVLMPQTPNATPLPSVDKEARDIIHTAAIASMQHMTLNVPTVSSVLRQLPLHNLVHFACHRVSDYANPSDSYLMLADTKLTVQQILRTHAAEPDVAFLSACSTAHSHEKQLADESIHIASSFQLMGFRHVVGTLWTADDMTCQEIARKFYSHLLGDDNDEWDGTWKVAEALHAATSSMQNREPKFPLLWAPFMTFGG
jgi:CHAT domain-containing protein